MFNVEKTLLFIVTIITSAAFLFFIPHFHLSIEFGSLITIHRIKSFLTLLSPIIFGAITAYIAYQQHCLAKTQANISRDQRDIAHNKQRIENYEKLYPIYNENCNLLNAVVNLPHSYPITYQFKIPYDSFKNLSDLVDADLSEEITAWSKNMITKKNKIYDLLNVCDLNREKSKFMLDDETFECVSNVLKKINSLFVMKIDSIYKQMYDGVPSYILEVRKKERDLEDLFIYYTNRMKKYMDIHDIISPRKFE